MKGGDRLDARCGRDRAGDFVELQPFVWRSAFDGYGTNWAAAGVLKRPHVIDWLIELLRQERRFDDAAGEGRALDTRNKRAQMRAFTDYPVFTRKV